MNSTNSTNLTNPTASIDPFFLIANLLTLPSIAAFGFCTNVVCLAVLLHPSLKGDTYKLLVSKTVAHLLCEIALSMSPYVQCSICPASRSLGAQIYMVYILIFMANSASFYAALIEMILAYERLFLLKSARYWFARIFAEPTVAALSFISISLNVPYLFAYHVEWFGPPSSGRFRWWFTAFGVSSTFRIYVIFLNFLQSTLSLVVLIVLNSLVTIEFKKYINRKRQMTIKHSENRQANSTMAAVTESQSHQANAEKSFTLMILISSIFYTISCIIWFAYTLMVQIFRLRGDIMNPIFIYVSFSASSTTMTYFASNLFIYLTFNRNFRSCFKKMFLLIAYCRPMSNLNSTMVTRSDKNTKLKTTISVRPLYSSKTA
jgi:hypothetical protein